jgi:pyruvate/2-oxoglutarate dehydrogenase complex dihydrolipoamide dehydrogenase (E3) component
VHHAAAFGLITGSPAIELQRVRQRKRDMVDGLVAMHPEQYRASGAELVMGEARFVGPKMLEVRLNDGGNVSAGRRARVPQRENACHDSTGP